MNVFKFYNEHGWSQRKKNTTDAILFEDLIWLKIAAAIKGLNIFEAIKSLKKIFVLSVEIL